MRHILFSVISILLFGTSLAAEEKSISVGMNLKIVQERLENQGVGTNWKHMLSISSGDKNIGLEFSKLDDEFTLVISYDIKSKKVTGLSVWIIGAFKQLRNNEVRRLSI